MAPFLLPKKDDVIHSFLVSAPLQPVNLPILYSSWELPSTCWMRCCLSHPSSNKPIRLLQLTVGLQGSTPYYGTGVALTSCRLHFEHLQGGRTPWACMAWRHLVAWKSPLSPAQPWPDSPPSPQSRPVSSCSRNKSDGSPLRGTAGQGQKGPPSRPLQPEGQSPT